MLATAVAEVIDQIRPVVQLDHGDVALADVDELTGVVTLELTGACVGCTSSGGDLRAGVERILRDRVPAVTAVIAVPSATCDSHVEPCAEPA